MRALTTSEFNQSVLAAFKQYERFNNDFKVETKRGTLRVIEGRNGDRSRATISTYDGCKYTGCIDYSKLNAAGKKEIVEWLKSLQFERIHYTFKEWQKGVSKWDFFTKQGIPTDSYYIREVGTPYREGDLEYIELGTEPIGNPYK